jgi:hypothetical protein
LRLLSGLHVHFKAFVLESSEYSVDTIDVAFAGMDVEEAGVDEYVTRTTTWQ